MTSFPMFITTSSNQHNHCRENSADADLSDDESYDM